MHRLLTALLLPLALSLPLRAADWPQFLGPNRDGSSPEAVTPWKGERKPVWKKPVGEAHSSPVVADGVVYAFYQPKGKDADALAAFDARTGELQWEKSYDREKFTPLFGNGPRSTPLVSGGKVFTLGGTGILACWDARTGAIAWKVDTLKEFKARNLFFGVSTSPLMAGENMVVVMVGGKGAGVVAVDARTGKTIWQAADDPASYSSPVLGDAARGGQHRDRQHDHGRVDRDPRDPRAGRELCHGESLDEQGADLLLLHAGGGRRLPLHD